MHSTEFIEETINKLTIDSFEQLKNIFIEECHKYNIIYKMEDIINGYKQTASSEQLSLF